MDASEPAVRAHGGDYAEFVRVITTAEALDQFT
jgi:hypothetical protein